MTKKNKSGFNVYLLTVMGLLLLVGSGLSAVEVSEGPPETGKIVFFQFEIHRGAQNSSDWVKLVNTLVREGDLKNDAPAALDLTENHLKFSFLDPGMKTIQTKSLRNPLNQRHEYVLGDHVTLASQVVNVDHASFFLRTRYDGRIKYLLIERPGKTGKSRTRELERIGLIELDLASQSTCGYDARIQDFDVVKVKDNGPDAEKIVWVVMAEGYQASELGTFMSDVNNWMTGQFNTAPYDSYEDDFNVYAIKVISNESGAAMDPGNLIDNYFGSTYWYAGIERLLYPTKQSTIASCLADHVPNYDQPLIIVNHSKYGGSGGWCATASTHADGDEILFHEVGHSFVDLADEYWAGSQYAAEKANMTQDNNPATIRWKDYLGIENIGIYQHTGYPWYRPHQSCKMRYLGYSFCLVCREATSDVIESYGGSGGGCSGYCASTHSNCYQYIQRVRLGAIDNSTSCSSGYADYTAQSATLTKGVGSTLRINVYYYGWPGNRVHAWIDWNQDCDFDDANEHVYSYQGSASPYQTTVTPPAGAVTGPTRMRVSCFYYDTPASCGSFGYGETEDYTINVIE